MDGVQLSQGYRATLTRQFTFYYSVPMIFWYSFNRPRKDERLSQPCSHPVVLNLRPRHWEISALTTRFRRTDLTTNNYNTYVAQYLKN